jgi:hypothetical protein
MDRYGICSGQFITIQWILINLSTRFRPAQALERVIAIILSQRQTPLGQLRPFLAAQVHGRLQQIDMLHQCCMENNAQLPG